MEAFPLIPERASELAVRFEWLFWYITAVTSIAGLGVYGAMAYFCVKYRRGSTTGSTPRILGSHRLELIWTITPLIIFLTFYVWGALVYDYAVHPPEDAEEIFIVGKQWMWKAQYQTGHRVIVGGNPANMNEKDRANIGKLVLPIGRPVKITITSEDVIHDFGVPAFRSKIDALPGRYVSTWYHPIKLGEYDIFCDQYCGTWHSLMVGKIKVVSQDEYDSFLQGTLSAQGTDNPVEGSPAQLGSQLFLKLQCIECHSANSAARAPVLEELYLSKVPLRGGGSTIADEGYIRQSIRQPRAKVVDGWNEIMPHYDMRQVNEEQLSQLVAYIRSLKKGKTPTRNENFPAPVGAPTQKSQAEETK